MNLNKNYRNFKQLITQEKLLNIQMNIEKLNLLENINTNHDIISRKK